MLDARHYAEEIAEMGLNGVPVMSVEDIRNLDQAEMREVAWSEGEVRWFLQSQEQTPPESGGLQTTKSNHVSDPFTDYSQVPVTLYADQQLQDNEGSWKSDITTAFDKARDKLQGETDVNIYQYYVMEVGAGAYDVSTTCGLQETAIYEQDFPDHAFYILLFSQGDIDGSWGTAIHRPIHAQWELYDGGGKNHDGMNNYCGTGERETIPAAYVKHKPWGSVDWLHYLTAHENGHVWEMEHGLGYCNGDWPQYRSILTFTSSSNTPSSCHDNADPRNQYEWGYTSKNNDRAWSERQKVTTCYNNPAYSGSCASESYPHDSET